MSMYELLEETQTEQKTNADNADCIVLLVDGGFTNKKSYDQIMVGASMYNWVVRACPTKPTLAQYNQEDDLLTTVRPLLKNGEYTVVLFSDTPLVTASGVRQMIDFAVSKGLPVARFARGYVFKTSYIKNALSIYAVNSYDVCSSELYQVVSTDSLIYATNVLINRIIKYHIQNGVNIVSPNNTYIECGVSIASGATIEPFVKIEGNSFIDTGAKICSGCVVLDSQIKQGAVVKSHANITRSIVSNLAIVGANSVVTNKSVVGEETIIGAGCILDNSTTVLGGKIGANCTLINTKLAKNVDIGVCSKCLGTESADVKIGANATVANNCTLHAGVYLKTDSSLPAGSTLKV